MVFILPAHAQGMDNEASAARLEKIERDLMLLQRQISRSSGSSLGNSGSAPAGSADLEVRLSAIEDQLRELLGKTEENDFQVKKLAQNLDKIQRDTDFRFGELTHTGAPAAVAPAAGSPSLTPPPAPETTLKPRNPAADAIKPAPDKNEKSIGKVVDTAVSNPTETADTNNDDASTTDFANSREHYNYAFRLLNQTQYDKAADSFASFIKKYPKDPLIGNAYYWQGEILYIRRNYIGAADSFRQGFEELPTGPKAPDNLLKLAMTLNAIKRDKEACVVLTQVVSKFKATSAAVSQKAEQERKRIGCSN